MRDDFLPFSRPSISEDDISAVADVLRSGWITTGPNNAKFEQAVCEYTGCNAAVAIASATAGMHMVLNAFNIGPGDEVITPSLTWVSTINLITLSGAKVVFADVDRDTLMVTPESVEKCITSKTRMIIPVHYAGAAADMDPIREIAKKHDLILIEDAAHAIGTEYKGERIGKKGTAIFSFHPIKNITTGEGGMLCSDDAELITRIRRLKFHGLGVDAYDRKTQGRSPQAQVQEPGYKYNMTDISAVLGIHQLARLDEFNRRRTELAMLYRQKLAGIPGIVPLSDPDYSIKHAWHLFIVRLDTEKAGISRDDFMQKLKEYNIGTGLHFKAAHQQKYYRETLAIENGALPNTDWNSDRILSLPLFPDMVDTDIDDVVEAIKVVVSEGTS